VKRRLLALACCLSVAGWLASEAAACHSEIRATLDCNGAISYTATAWNDSGATTAQRTNSNVAVWVTINGQTQTQTGHFGSDNNFSFSGTLSAGSAQSATVYVQEKAKWASGDSPEAARSVTVTRPSNCGSGTTPPPNTPPGQNTPPAAPPVPPAPPASISLVKLERVGTTGAFEAGPVNAKVGQTVYYEIVVTNTGPAVSLSVADPGCTGLTPTGPQALETGKSMTFTCSHTIVAADGASYTNVATATGTPASNKPATATASAVANVVAGGVLGVTAQTKPATVHKHVKVKKVTKVAKPARAVVQAASFTG